MTLRADARHGLRIGRAEFRRSVRAYTADARRLAGVGLLVAIVGGNVLFASRTCISWDAPSLALTLVPTLALAAGGLAVGVGCAYPIDEERELWGTETVAPSTFVMMAYSAVVIGGTAG